MRICISPRNITGWLIRRLRQEQGQSLVEFAIVLPVLILIILGIIYFGRYEDYANQETQLAEEGVRWAALDWTASSYTMPSQCASPNNTLQCYIQAQAQPELQTGSSDVSAAQIYIYQPTSATAYSVGQPVRVCVTTNVKFPTPLGVPTLTIAQAATMRIETIPQGATSLPYTSGNPSSATTPPSATGCPTS